MADFKGFFTEDFLKNGKYNDKNALYSKWEKLFGADTTDIPALKGSLRELGNKVEKAEPFSYDSYGEATRHSPEALEKMTEDLGKAYDDAFSKIQNISEKFMNKREQAGAKHKPAILKKDGAEKALMEARKKQEAGEKLGSREKNLISADEKYQKARAKDLKAFDKEYEPAMRVLSGQVNKMSENKKFISTVKDGADLTSEQFSGYENYDLNKKLATKPKTKGQSERNKQSKEMGQIDIEITKDRLDETFKRGKYAPGKEEAKQTEKQKENHGNGIEVDVNLNEKKKTPPPLPSRDTQPKKGQVKKTEPKKDEIKKTEPQKDEIKKDAPSKGGKR